MTFARAFAFVAVCISTLASAGCGGAKSEAKSPESKSAKAPSAPPAGCQVRETKDETFVACFEKRVGLQLPLTGWRFSADKGKTPAFLNGELVADSEAFFVSVLDGPLAPSNYDQRVVLEAVFHSVQKGNESEGLSVGEKQLTAGRNGGRLYLSYEIFAKELEEAHARSLHFWTAQPREDGSLVFYHASWTGPASAPPADLKMTLGVMTDLFFILDAEGKTVAPPTSAPAPATPPSAAPTTAQN